MNSLQCKRRFHQIGKRGRNFLKSRALALTAKGLLCFVDGKVYTAGLIGGRGPNLITWAGPQNHAQKPKHGRPPQSAHRDISEGCTTCEAMHRAVPPTCTAERCPAARLRFRTDLQPLKVT